MPRWLVHCWNVALRGQSEAWEYVSGPIRLSWNLELLPNALLVRNPGYRLEEVEYPPDPEKRFDWRSIGA